MKINSNEKTIPKIVFPLGNSLFFWYCCKIRSSTPPITKTGKDMIPKIRMSTINKPAKI